MHSASGTRQPPPVTTTLRDDVGRHSTTEDLLQAGARAAAAGNWRQACESWRVARLQFPDHPGIAFSYARACVHARRYRPAEGILTSLAGSLTAADELEASVYLASCLVGLRRWRDASALCADIEPRVRSQQPWLLPYLLGNTAIAEHRCGMVDRARQAAIECVEKQFHIPAAWRVLMWIHIRQRKPIVFLKLFWGAAKRHVDEQHGARGGRG